MYNDDKVRIIGQARSSFHLGALESVYLRVSDEKYFQYAENMIQLFLTILKSVYIKTQYPVLCRQKESVFPLGLFNQEKSDSTPIGHKSN